MGKSFDIFFLYFAPFCCKIIQFPDNLFSGAKKKRKKKSVLVVVWVPSVMVSVDLNRVVWLSATGCHIIVGDVIVHCKPTNGSRSRSLN
jgi:hypothetical protein